MRSRYDIPLSEIPEQGLVLELETPPDQLHLTEADARVSGVIRSSVRLNRIDRSVVLEGSVAGDAELQCVRCLQPVTHVLKVEFRVFMEPPPSEESGETDREVSGEEFERQFIQNETICLDDVIREQIMLDLPSYPLCKEACRGLCPVCGVDLNKGSCDCSGKDPEPRLNPLQEQIKKIIKS
ncbi:MAG TPA: DUF177 domain-containing protein [Nitrospiria bacterium]